MAPSDILFAIANKAFWSIATGVPFPAGDAVYVDTLTVYVAEMFPKHPRFGSIEQLGDQPLDQRDRTGHLAASACVEGRHFNVWSPGWRADSKRGSTSDCCQRSSGWPVLWKIRKPATARPASRG